MGGSSVGDYDENFFAVSYDDVTVLGAEATEDMQFCCASEKIPFTPLNAQDSVESAIQKMDFLYKTSFAHWIKNEDNLMPIINRFKNLFLFKKYSQNQIRKAFVWITKDWCLGSILILVSEVCDNKRLWNTQRNPPMERLKKIETMASLCVHWDQSFVSEYVKALVYEWKDEREFEKKRDVFLMHFHKTLASFA